MSYHKSQATREFTNWSESYDRSILQWLLFGPAHRAILQRLRALDPDRSPRVLDVGCGTGVFASRIREVLPRSQVWGVDLVAGMLAGGRERWGREAGDLHPVQGDSERLPFADGSFDVLTCANSFHHYPNQARAVAEFRRVLKPGGRVILVDGYRDGPLGWLIFDVFVASFEGAVHHNSRTQMRKLFADAGFGEITLKVHRNLAPFLLTEAITDGDAAPSRAASEQGAAIRQREGIAI